LDNEGINDLVTIDHEGFLAFYRQVERDGKRVLLPGRRIFKMRGPSVYNCDHQPQVSADPSGEGLLQLNCELSFRSGRRTFCFVDWNGDGRLDLLVNAVPNVNLLRNVSETPGEWIFVDEGPVDPQVIANHNTAPAVIPGGGSSGRPGLLIGAEDGLFYRLE